VFTSLERLEQILGQHRYLTGNQLTEADIRLWTTRNSGDEYAEDSPSPRYPASGRCRAGNRRD
jgi:glutathione S-transferase